MEREYWSGQNIDELKDNEIFVFGSNPQARHFAGAAKAALKFGAKPRSGKENGIGRGLSPNKKTYALITKNLEAGIVVDGIKYDKEGYCSVSKEQIQDNISEMYECAKKHPDKKFLITYKYETWPNGSEKKSLNGYSPSEMIEMFSHTEIPKNIVFHDSYKLPLENYINKIKNIDSKSYSKPTIGNSSYINTKTTSIVGNKFAKDVKFEGNLIVVSPRDNVPEGFVVINTTSRDTDGFGKKFSPFLLKNIPLYGDVVAKNMENAWQYAKVYKEFMDEQGNPTNEYFEWAKKGWNSNTAVRYPNGKGAKAEYSYWETKDEQGNIQSHHWDYVTARKNIYIPLYARAIEKTPAFKELQTRYQKGEKIALWDFDGYNHYEKNMSFSDVVHNEKRCGHAFVIYGLLKGYIKVLDNEVVYDFSLEKNNSITEKSKEIKSVPNELKNLYPSSFNMMSVDFFSVEQFMIYSKAKFAGDHETARIIMVLNEEELVQKFQEGKISANDIATNKEYYAEWVTLMNALKEFNKEIKISQEQSTQWKSTAPNLLKIALKEKFVQNEELKPILKNYIKGLSKEDINSSPMNAFLAEVSKDVNTKKKTVKIK